MKRRYYTGSDLDRVLSIEDFRHRAKKVLPAFAWEFLEGGAEDEKTLSWNREILQSLRLVPDTLVDVGTRSIGIELFGRRRSSPLIIAPTGQNNMMRRDGDLKLARAAAAEDIPFTLSTMSNTRLERIAEQSTGEHWMQLYMFEDERMTEGILRRAEAAGYEALVLTTDANVYGLREWDRRHFSRPAQLTLPSMIDVAMHPMWAKEVLWEQGLPRMENLIDYLPDWAKDIRTYVLKGPTLFQPKITWRHVEELRRKWPRKLIVKGILTPDDAGRALDAGADGIVLTNHGARHLDTTLSPIEPLPEIAARYGDRLAIIVDSGIRRGSDVVKIMALGAHAIMVGRVPLYGLAAAGEAGARKAIQLLNQETDRVMGQIGCARFDDLDTRFLKAGPFELPAEAAAKRTLSSAAAA